MKCRKVTEKMWLYLEGDLSNAQELEVRQHLALCESCRDLLDEGRESQNWMKSLRPPDFDARLYSAIRRATLERIQKEAPSGNFALSWVADHWRQVAVCALAVLVFFVALRVKRTPGVHINSSQSASNHESIPSPSRNTAPPTLEATKRPPKRVVHPRHRPSGRTPLGELDATQLAENQAGPAANVPAGGPPLRIEIQTADPNVRIIWFVPGGREPAPPAEDKDTM